MPITVIDLTLVEGYPILFALERGYYREEGLDVTYDLVNAPVAIRGVLAGQYAFGSTSSGTIGAIMSGAPLRVVFAPTEVNTWSLYLGKGVADVKDLKGKSVAVSSLGGPMDSLTRSLLDKVGVSVDRDNVQIVAPGFTDDAKFAALEAGSVAGAVLHGVGQVVAEKAGFKRGVFFGDYLKRVESAISATETTIQQRPDLVRAFIRGTLKGMRFTTDKVGEAVPLYQKTSTLPLDIAQPYYELGVKHLQRTGKAAMATVQANIESDRPTVPNPSVVDPEKMVDWRFVDEGNASLEAGNWKA